MCNLYGVTKWATPALSGHEHQIAGSAAESQAVLWKGLRSDRKGVADLLQLPGGQSARAICVFCRKMERNSLHGPLPGLSRLIIRKACATAAAPTASPPVREFQNVQKPRDQRLSGLLWRP